MFSNLENLKELHLTDAFHDNETPNFASHLQEVFTNSSMNKLEKLHLEQNEISNFSDLNVFCSLENLLDLYLANNNLTKLHFRIDCLPRLRFLDLEANLIRSFTKKQLAQFDALPARNQSLTIDVSRNPFVCDCKTDLYAWMRTTQVVVRRNSSLQCRLGTEKREILLKDFHQSFCAKIASGFDETSHTTHTFANLLILAILCGLIVLLFKISARYSIDYFRHSAGVSSGKVHYVVIQNFDENREVRV
ncbi:hypothetical protein V9T40_004334 [Parthenolecanium corni]|uniref:LRRCT domain-containing protein n=1 Tax=Parthenolecanium corni TaxID=536013 RepID=A0AAN9TTT4_9HEMI